MTTVITDGKAQQVAKAWPLANTTYAPSAVYPQTGVELIGLNQFARYDQLYRSQHWIGAVVNKLARGIARLPAKTYRLDVDTGARERLRRHPLPVLLSRPHPRGSSFGLFETTVCSVALYGNALWWKYRPRVGMAPVELWPLDWRNIVIHTGSSSPVDHYEYQGVSGGSRRFLPDEVVHFKWWSPDGFQGISPLEQLATTLSLEDAGQRYATASFRNAARPAGAIVGGNLNAKQRDELRNEIRAVHEGPDNAFRLALLSGLQGATWQPFSHTSQEAQTIEHRKLNREEICAVYDIPPPIVGILDHATFSNIDEQHKMLYVDTLGPWLTMIEETLGAQLLWGEAEFTDAFVEFDLREVLKADVEKRGTAYAQMRAAGIYTSNELRDAENLPRIDNPAADAVLLPMNNVAVGDGDQLTLLAPEPEPEAIDETSGTEEPPPS